jgi:hypothetical protein
MPIVHRAATLGEVRTALREAQLAPLREMLRDDFVVDIPMSKPALRKDPGLPPSVRVRVFKAGWKSSADEESTECFATPLFDAERFRRHTLAVLYHERWRIETGYREFKQTFHADVLRSKPVENA